MILKKDSLRKKYKQLRSNLSEHELETKSNQITVKVIAQIKKIKPRVIHCFMPIIKKREVDTLPIFNYCWEHNIKTVIPISDLYTNNMKCSLINKNTILKNGAFNTLEPINFELINESDIEMIITPLMAFDKFGYRVGYGKGFYDKFFKTLNSNVIKTGVSIFEIIEKVEDVTEYDIRLNNCITPSNIYSF